MKQMDFRHWKGKDFISRYIIHRENDIVYIENFFFPETCEDPELDNFFIHAANIPEALEAIEFVFRAKMGRGESKHFSGNGENGYAIMGTERQITKLSLDVENQIHESDSLTFYFDRNEIPVEPEKRIHTPAMIWVMDAMKEEYEAWKKEQG